MDKMELSKIARQVKAVVTSPEWEVFRDYAALQFRQKIYQAMRETDTDKKLQAIDRAAGILELSQGLELEDERLTVYLNKEEMAKDNAQARSRIRSMGGGPKPFKDEDDDT